MRLRLIQAAAKSLPSAIETKPDNKAAELSWTGVEDILTILPGQTIEQSIIPDAKMYKSLKKSTSSMTLVVFIGGCTLSEVSALRTISQNEKCIPDLITIN